MLHPVLGLDPKQGGYPFAAESYDNLREDDADEQDGSQAQGTLLASRGNIYGQFGGCDEGKVQSYGRHANEGI